MGRFWKYNFGPMLNTVVYRRIIYLLSITEFYSKYYIFNQKSSLHYLEMYLPKTIFKANIIWTIGWLKCKKKILILLKGIFSKIYWKKKILMHERIFLPLFIACPNMIIIEYKSIYKWPRHQCEIDLKVR